MFDFRRNSGTIKTAKFVEKAGTPSGTRNNFAKPQKNAEKRNLHDAQ